MNATSGYQKAVINGEKKAFPRPFHILFGGILIAGVVPLVFFWVLFGQVQAFSPEDARTFLTDPDTTAALVDTRTPEEYRRKHIDGALNWPFADIMTVAVPDGIPDRLKTKDLFLICDAGFDSARAAGRLNDIGLANVYNVKGGYQEWVRGTGGREGMFYRIRTESGEVRPFPAKASSLFEQLAVCTAAFVFKPFYMLLSLLLIWRLRQQTAEDLLAVKWALFFFLVGEAFCAVNYLFFGESSYLVEYLHILGMLAAFGVFIYAMFGMIDMRILHIRSQKQKCAAQALCRDCYKYSETTCGFVNLLTLITAGLLVLCAMPPLTGVSAVSYNTDILGATYTYIHPAVFQYFETAAAPVSAGMLFIGSLVISRRSSAGSIDAGLALFCAGAGFWGFSMFRTILFGLFQDNLVWFVIWEEITELLFISIIAAFLWIFRHRLLVHKHADR